MGAPDLMTSSPPWPPSWPPTAPSPYALCPSASPSLVPFADILDCTVQQNLAVNGQQGEGVVSLLTLISAACT